MLRRRYLKVMTTAVICAGVFFPIVFMVITQSSLSVVSTQSTRLAERIREDFQDPLPVSAARSEFKPKRNGTLYVCGFKLGNLQNYLFPDFIHIAGMNASYPSFEELPNPKKEKNFHNGGDILLYGMGGPCPSISESQRVAMEWVTSSFPGKSIFINGESKGDVTSNGSGNVFMLSSSPETSNNLPVMFGAVVLVGIISEDLWPMITWAESPRAQTDHFNKTFLAFFTKNCMAYGRRSTAYLLSSIGEVHHATCIPSGFGRIEDYPQIYNIGNKRNLRTSNEIQRTDWVSNQKLLQNYKFALVIENEAKSGYITEKIINAFVAGCIPIYYGHYDIFKVFNRKAFVWWDPHDPNTPDRVLPIIMKLHTDYDAYREMMRQPVLVDGNDTLRKYFSLTDKIGGGYLKRQIRLMMKIELPTGNETLTD